VAELGPPDDALLRAVLVKLCHDRQLVVSVEVIDFLCLRIERSFAAVRRVAAAIDKASLAAQRRITIPLAQQVLAEQDPMREEQGG
jgi:chromosomal replication initiation ATPase DnaA